MFLSKYANNLKAVNKPVKKLSVVMHDYVFTYLLPIFDNTDITDLCKKCIRDEASTSTHP